MSSMDRLRVNSYHVTNFHFANVTSGANFSIGDGLVHFLSLFPLPPNKRNGRTVIRMRSSKITFEKVVVFIISGSHCRRLLFSTFTYFPHQTAATSPTGSS